MSNGGKISSLKNRWRERTHQMGVWESEAYKKRPHLFSKLGSTLKQRWGDNPRGIQNRMILGALESLTPPRQYIMGEGGKYERNPQFMEHIVMGSLGSTSKAGRAIRAGKSKVVGFPNKMITKRGGASREVVTVKMSDESGKHFMQPFYKSSGKSSLSKDQIARGVRAERKDTWEPFLGRTQMSVATGPKSYYVDKAGGSVEGFRGWYIKGEKHSASPIDYTLVASKPDLGGGLHGAGDKYRRLGDYVDVSKEISRLEKLGYYKESAVGKGPVEMNKWLAGQGHFRPMRVGLGNK